MNYPCEEKPSFSPFFSVLLEGRGQMSKQGRFSHYPLTLWVWGRWIFFSGFGSKSIIRLFHSFLSFLLSFLFLSLFSSVTYSVIKLFHSFLSFLLCFLILSLFFSLSLIYSVVRLFHSFLPFLLSLSFLSSFSSYLLWIP